MWRVAEFGNFRRLLWGELEGATSGRREREMLPGLLLWSEVPNMCPGCCLLSHSTRHASLVRQADGWVAVNESFRPMSSLPNRVANSSRFCKQRLQTLIREQSSNVGSAGKTDHLSRFGVRATVPHMESNYSWWCHLRVMMAREELVDELDGEDYVHPHVEIQFTSRHLYLLPESQGIT